MLSRRIRSLVLASVVGSAAVLACGQNLVTGSKMSVPPVRRVPVAIEGATVRLADDAAIETNEPVYQQRARDNLIPSQLRAAIEQALGDAGLRVVRDKTSPADLEARIALSVSDVGGRVRQLYRCKLLAPDGQEVEQVDWAWPDGTFVRDEEVLEFAAHNVVSEIAISPKVWAWFHDHPRGSALRDGG